MTRSASAIAACLLAGSACSGASDGPVIVGKIAASSAWQGLASMAAANVDVSVNGDLRRVALGQDGSFAMDGLPSGDLVLRFTMADLDGSVAIHHTTPGERIELDVRPVKDGVDVKIVRRQPPMLSGETDVVPPPDGTDIVVRDHHAVVRLAGGMYPGNLVIHGHHLVVTSATEACGADDVPLIAGDLIVTGHHVTVAGLVFEGAVDVRGGEEVKLWSTCVDATDALHAMVRSGEG